MDSYTLDNDKNIIKSIIKKIIKYYSNLYEYAKFDDEDRIILYGNIMKTLKIKPNENEIIIELDNDKKILLNLCGKIKIKSTEWNQIIPLFNDLLKGAIIKKNYDEYINSRDKIMKVKVKTDHEYDENN
jgi:predicted transcriptional regulator